MSSILGIVSSLLGFLSIAIFARIIMDWLIVGKIMQPNNTLRQAVVRITEPILAPIRRYARIGTIDLSPMVAILILTFIQSRLAAG